MRILLDKVGKHVVAVLLFLALVMAYFSPGVFEGKVISQSDNIKAAGMGGSQVDEYAKTAEEGEFSVWSDAMFSGMPYGPGYGNPAPELPSYSIIDGWLKKVGYTHAAMVFVGLVCFYLLMCIMGVNWWLAIAGAIAFAFASYNIIIIVAGHIVKAYVIAYMPVTLAGMILLFRRRYLWGAVIFLLGVAFSIANGHVQITYYLALLCFFIYLGYAIRLIREKSIGELGKVSAIMVGCVILAVLPNTQHLYSNWDLSQHSTRGPTELTTTTPAGEKISTGLDKDYAFHWSYGRMELLTLLVPNAYGGASIGTLGSDSELYKEMKANGAQVGKEIQTYTYWGDKMSTSGPVYFGALVCFLFVLGMFVIRNPMKWWLFAASVFFVFLALGRYFDLFNDVVFHHLPLYNKFRTVEMALVIPGLIFPVVAIWGLRELFAGNVGESVLKKGFLWALGLTGGICLILWLMPSLLLTFQSPMDVNIQNQFPDWYYTALLRDRASLTSADALRSLIFILLGAALLFWYWKAKDKKKTAVWVSAGIAVLMLADLWTVDRRYLNDSNYVKESPQESYKKRLADEEILKDTDQSYRVLGLNNPWEETTVSYFHHSLGGYHAVKLRRYQELIEHRLNGEYRNIIGALQKAQTIRDILPALASSPSLNMLNTRYIIYNPDQAPIRNPFAYGNAWFVDKVNVVANADGEIEALNTIDPQETAVVDKRFAKDLAGFIPEKDTTATIVLEKYRPNRLTYKTKASSEQLAVFSEIYYPGWKVTIDGKETTHFRADWILRAMLIPAGEHTVVFDFYPENYVIAANISSYSSFLILLLLIVAVGWSGWKYWRQQRSATTEIK